MSIVQDDIGVGRKKRPLKNKSSSDGTSVQGSTVQENCNGNVDDGRLVAASGKKVKQTFCFTLCMRCIQELPTKQDMTNTGEETPSTYYLQKTILPDGTNPFSKDK